MFSGVLSFVGQISPINNARVNLLQINQVIFLFSIYFFNKVNSSMGMVSTAFGLHAWALARTKRHS